MSDQEQTSAAGLLRAEVKVSLKERDAGETGARARVVDQLVETEMGRRTEILSEAMVKHAQLKAELDKVRPDETKVTVSEDGTRTKVAFFNEKSLKDRDKCADRLTKLDRLLDAVFNSPSADAYNKLKEWK